jgi:hypothetical protein
LPENINDGSMNFKITRTAAIMAIDHHLVAIPHGRNVLQILMYHPGLATDSKCSVEISSNSCSLKRKLCASSR